MREITAIISISAVFLIAGQTCIGSCAGGLFGFEEFLRAGSIGFIVSFLYMIGGAFVIGIPKVSIIAFTVAGITGLVNGATSIYDDMYIWGGLALVLAIMSYLGHRNLVKSSKSGHHE